MAESQYFGGLFVQSTSNACVVDLVPPTFSGISGLISNANGSLTASWATGSDSSGPISYEVYVQLSTATGLFNLSNIATIVRGTSAVLYTLPNGNTFDDDQTYYVGVRAIDGLGNRETNSVSLNAVSTGVANRTSVTKVHGLFSIDAANMLSGDFWVTVDDNFSSIGLGTASYTIYDKDGNTVGITESSISADGDGVFRITPALASPLQDLTHYLAKITIMVNSQPVTAYKGITLGE